MKPSILTRFLLATALALAAAANGVPAQQAAPEPKSTTPAATRTGLSHPFLCCIQTSGAKPSHVFGTIHLRFRTMMTGYSPALRQHFDEELLAKRNRRMAGRIAEKLRASPDKSHFFALGAMHYVGQSSVLERLRMEGFKIERLPK